MTINKGINSTSILLVVTSSFCPSPERKGITIENTNGIIIRFEGSLWSPTGGASVSKFFIIHDIAAGFTSYHRIGGIPPFALVGGISQ